MRIWVEGGFDGKDFYPWMMDTFWLIWELVLRPEGSKGFVLLPKQWMQWMVERPYRWLHWCHRLNVNYERLPESSEASIHIAMTATDATQTGVTNFQLSVFLNILLGFTQKDV